MTKDWPGGGGGPLKPGGGGPNRGGGPLVKGPGPIKGPPGPMWGGCMAIGGPPVITKAPGGPIGVTVIGGLTTGAGPVKLNSKIYVLL